MTNKLTKEYIVHLLETNDKAVGRALLVLLNRQTAVEQACQRTEAVNGRGFTGFDAKIGTSMAQQFQRKGKLSDAQVAVWRKKDKRGNMKIAKYWKQLIEAAEEKAAQKEAS